MKSRRRRVNTHFEPGPVSGDECPAPLLGLFLTLNPRPDLRVQNIER
jgi:hypothetical protein